MELEFVKTGELEQYAEAALSRFESDIPISLPRARSQALNPNARKDDVLLIAAFEERKLLSFIGSYPSVVQNDPEKRIFWISCWWKATGVSSQVSHLVLEKFLEITEGQVGVPHLPPHIINILQQKEIEVTGRDGLMLRLRSALHQRSLQRSLKGKYHRLIGMVRFTGALKGIDFMANIFDRKPIAIRSKGTCPDFSIHYEVPGDEYFEFVQKNFPYWLTLPSKKDISWICSNPWLVTPREAEKSVIARYHFSYVAENFHHFFPILKKENEIVGAGFFSYRDGAVKSLILGANQNYEKEFYREVTRFIIGYKQFHTLITYEQGYSDFLKNHLRGSRKAKSIRRYTGIANPEYHGLTPSDADGDSCFT